MTSRVAVPVVLLVVALAFAACGGGSLEEFSREREQGDAGGGSNVCGAVETTPDEGADHVAAGESFDFPSYPPASGPHDPVPLSAGAYDEPLTRGASGSGETTMLRAVHSLEHGYVLVLYDGLAANQRDELVREFGRERKVIVAPDRDLDDAVVLVAWRRIQRCTRFDATAVERFIADYRERTAPEPRAA